MQVARTAWVDWYVDGERSAVFVDGQVMVLSELATSLLSHVGHSVDPVDATRLHDVAAALVDEFGPPEGGDAEASVRLAVRDLVACGVLVEVGP